MSTPDIVQPMVDAFAGALHQIRVWYQVYDSPHPEAGYNDALLGLIFVRKEVSAAFDGVCDNFMDRVLQAVRELERQT